ncbi:YopX family protein [Lactiplantibacillus plantarum]|uniref:YopX family protein n=1 Tax=Lactiplantibacillus plantarum TaxID=1590 RepID=UPI003F792F5E
MIKFRAWNQIDSEYINEINAVMSLDGSHIWWDINDSGEMKYDDDPGDYKLEQFTGLKDVNGKDIYEGDIVENERGEILRVSYSAIDASFVAGNCYFGSIGAGKEIRIIGNVHANPELLVE